MATDTSLKIHVRSFINKKQYLDTWELDFICKRLEFKQPTVYASANDAGMKWFIREFPGNYTIKLSNIKDRDGFMELVFSTYEEKIEWSILNL